MSETETVIQALPFVPSGIQLQDFFVRAIRAERSPKFPRRTHAVKFTVTSVGVSEQLCQANLVLDVQVDEAPDELFVSFVANFSYTEQFTEQQVEAIMREGVFSVLFPYIRETIHSLSIRMNIEPIILAMVAVAQEKSEPTSPSAKSEGKQEI